MQRMVQPQSVSMVPLKRNSAILATPQIQTFEHILTSDVRVVLLNVERRTKESQAASELPSAWYPFPMIQCAFQFFGLACVMNVSSWIPRSTSCLAVADFVERDLRLWSGMYGEIRSHPA